ncbi:NFACT RNA binding domain-containing protein [Cyanobium sp. NS01]|uniref:NFACT RNA binding domain-containing protein n=2 Tax=unclassified Cyanobium TaxID=2627006 RepID=UPI0018610ACE|nr:NFACT RNA binding domain-containing protein [Cyanobium sp. NS01]QNI71312.1 fibronectin-binding A family protein [Cyanobium sp. NS01]
MASLQAQDVTSLKAVLAEWRRLLLPSRLEKAQQAGPGTIQLGLRHLQGMQWLELSWQAEAARVHAIAPPPRQGEGSTLAQQLQHGLGGLALVSLQQVGWERVLELGFARRPGEAPQRWLVAELMGRHSNLLLLEPDGDGRQVVALGRQVKTAQSRLRPIGTGDPYQPPPPLDGAPPSRAESFERWRQRVALLPLPLEQALRSAYQGISPALARQLAPPQWLQQPVTELQSHQWELLWQRWQLWLAAVEAERFCWQGDAEGYRCWSAEPHAQPPASAAMPINRGLAAFYGRALAQQSLSQQRRQLQQQLERLLRREQQQAGSQQALLDAVPESDALQLQADALLSQFQPSRSCIDTAQKLYRQARRRRRSVAAIQERLAWHGQRLAWLEASLTYLDQAEDLEALQGLGRDLEEHLHPGGRPARQSRRGSGQGREGQPQPLELISPGGLTLQVGRNHRQNEWIAFRQARRGDLWFHAQELPGSHVVLRSSAAAAGDEDLQAAADLAAHFSRGRGNRRVPVLMVPTAELQRIPGAAPGTVRHRGGSLLWGEPERALSLLAARQP